MNGTSAPAAPTADGGATRCSPVEKRISPAQQRVYDRRKAARKSADKAPLSFPKNTRRAYAIAGWMEPAGRLTVALSSSQGEGAAPILVSFSPQELRDVISLPPFVGYQFDADPLLSMKQVKRLVQLGLAPIHWITQKL